MARIPGVYTNEIQVLNNNGTLFNYVTAIVGLASTGPLVPTYVKNLNQLQSLFGKAVAGDFGLVAAERVLQNGGDVLFIRVGNEGSKVKFQGSGESTSAFEAKVPGDLLSDAKIELTVDSSKKTVNIKLTKGDEDSVTLEELTLSSDENSPDFMIEVFNNKSTYLNCLMEDVPTSEKTYTCKYEASTNGLARAQATAEGAFTISTKYCTSNLNDAKVKILVSLDKQIKATIKKGGVLLEEIPFGPVNETNDAFMRRFNSSSNLVEISSITKLETQEVTLAGGSDGTTGVTNQDYIGSESNGLRAITDPQIFEFDTLLIPGISDSVVLKEAQALCNSRNDAIFLADPPLGLSSKQTVDWLEAKNVYSTSTRLNSSQVVVCSPWTFEYVDGDKFWLPPSIAMACLMAFNATKKFMWTACAGVSNGVLSSVDGIEYVPSRDDRQILYGDSKINPIIYDKTRGYVIYGNKTCLSPVNPAKPDPLCSLNVRRLVNYVKKNVIDVAELLIFAPNDSLTWAEFKLRVEPILRNIKDNRGLYNYQVIMDESTVTDDKIDELTMPGIIRLQPTRLAEYIDLTFEVNAAGVDFGGDN